MGRYAAYPEVRGSVPTAASPVVPFRNLELTNADVENLTTANNVNAIPTACVLEFKRVLEKGRMVQGQFTSNANNPSP